MTNDIGPSKRVSYSGLVIGHSLVIGILSLVISSVTCVRARNSREPLISGLGIILTGLAKQYIESLAVEPDTALAKTNLHSLSP
jgi:hypothetical protein